MNDHYWNRVLELERVIEDMPQVAAEFIAAALSLGLDHALTEHLAARIRRVLRAYESSDNAERRAYEGRR